MSDDVEDIKAPDPDATQLSAGPPPTSAWLKLLAPTSTIGHYRIIRLLGEGGMGTVYEAEQDHPRRRVALKVVKAAWAGPETLRRFELESQTLGRLHHPGIAQIYEAGATETASGPQPYFAMEIIKGLPVVTYARTHHLNNRQRLELMIKICDAVEHAHRRGIIHRDLKPGNILVDETGQPKILDFGLARVTDGDMQATRQTDIGQLLGTFAYMSPEQVLADPLALDTRSDVYALGVILYELLAGRLPYKVSGHVVEIVKTIQEVEPAPLSSISRDCRGDVETIVAKALEKDKARRYGSAAELAADLQRYLEDRPIAAKPASASYQLQKFARRNKTLVTGIAAVIFVLTLGAIVSSIEAVRARRASRIAAQQRDRADAEAAVAKAVNDFLQNDLLSQADSAEQGGSDSAPDPEVKVRTLLDRAAANVEKKFGSQPLVESQIEATIGQTYHGLGLNPQAEQHLRSAYKLSVSHRGSDAPETLEILMNLSGVLFEEDKNTEAVTAAKAAFEGETRVLGPDDPRTVVAMQNLGTLYLGTYQYAEGEPLLKKALDIQTRRNGYDNYDTLNTSDSLAELYIEQFRYAEARPYIAKALESYRRMYGPDHPFTDRERFGLGKVLFGEGNYAEAEKVFTECLASEGRVLGKRHPDALTTANLLGNTYVEEGKVAQAISILQNNLHERRQVQGPSARGTLKTQSDLGWAYDTMPDRSHAEQNFRSAMQGFQAMGKDQEDDLAETKELLGWNLIEQRKYSESAPLLRDALAYREKQNLDDWQLRRAQIFLGASLSGSQEFPEAEKMLLAGQQGFKQRLPRMPANQKRWLNYSERQLASLYSAWAKPDQAARWRATIQEH